MEIFGPDQAAERLKRKELLTLNGTRYCLVEFALDTEAHRCTGRPGAEGCGLLLWWPIRRGISVFRGFPPMY